MSIQPSRLDRSNGARSRIAPTSLLVLGFAVASGCDDDGDVEIVQPEPEAVTVDVTEVEFAITTDIDAVTPGPVTFVVTNAGTELHEFLVIRTDLDEFSLPVEADGSYFENGPGTELLDEIPDILPGETVELTLDLDAGNYVLICNMVMFDGVYYEAHYALGMHTSFLVTELPAQ